MQFIKGSYAPTRIIFSPRINKLFGKKFRQMAGSIAIIIK